MKKALPFFIILFIIQNSRAQITFQKLYGGFGGQDGISCEQTTDGGYILAGNGPDWGEFVLVKTNEQGNIQWSQDYSFSTVTYGELRHVMQTSDGGYLANGYVEDNGNQNVFAMKVSNIGGLMWMTVLDAGTDEYSYGAWQTTDGGYILAGSAIGISGSIFKLDVNGQFMWAKAYGSSEIYDVQQTADGGYCIAADVADVNYEVDPCIIKTDSNGDVQWAKQYSFGAWDTAGGLEQLADGGFILVGSSGNFLNQIFDPFLFRTDENGDVLWAKMFISSGWDITSYVQQTSDGGFMMYGTKDYTTASDVNLIKTDSLGNLQWSRRYGTAVDEFAWGKADQTADGGFLLPTFYLDANGESWSLLIKTDSNGVSGCNENALAWVTGNASVFMQPTVLSVLPVSFTTTPVIASLVSSGVDSTFCYDEVITSVGSESSVPEEEETVLLSPNPAGESITVSRESKPIEQVLICDVSGKMIKTISFPSSQNEITISVNDLNAGIYLVQLISEDEVVVKKLAKN